MRLDPHALDLGRGIEQLDTSRAISARLTGETPRCGRCSRFARSGHDVNMRRTPSRSAMVSSISDWSRPQSRGLLVAFSSRPRMRARACAGHAPHCRSPADLAISASMRSSIRLRFAASWSIRRACHAGNAAGEPAVHDRAARRIDGLDPATVRGDRETSHAGQHQHQRQAQHERRPDLIREAPELVNILPTSR